jgi:DNA-binding transcriptional ArsR family regulator
MGEKLYSEKEYESILIKTLGDSPKLRIVDFFLDNPLFDFTKKEVIEALGMSKQTFYKYFPELEEYGIVKVSRKIGKAKLYRINVEHPLVKMLRDYETKMSKEMAEKAKMKKPILARLRALRKDYGLPIYEVLTFLKSFTPSISVTYSNPASISSLASSTFLAALQTYSSECGRLSSCVYFSVVLGFGVLGASGRIVCPLFWRILLWLSNGVMCESEFVTALGFQAYGLSSFAPF